MADTILKKRIKQAVAAFVFGGDIRKSDNPHHLDGLGWCSIEGREADKHGACPSYERCLAVPLMMRVNPRLIVIPSGGVTNIPEENLKSPPISTVMKAELLALGVPEKNILEEPEAFNTEQQLIKCAAIARAHGWRGRDCVIVTMKWQFGRILSMQRALKGQVRPFTARTNFLAVERILENSENGEFWKRYFDELNASPDMQARILKEAAGIEQLLTGHPKPYKNWKDPLALGSTKKKAA